MGFINDASKEVCGARGVTVVGPAKAELSFRPELHATMPREAARWTPKAKAVDPAPADASRPPCAHWRIQYVDIGVQMYTQ
jgi:hypothetical protein